jgi:hypothetical protein
MATERYTSASDFQDKVLRPHRNHATSIIADYQAQGFVLTVRQLYYQLVARDVIENSLKSYKRITSHCQRCPASGGMLDWDAIEDRTRDFVRKPTLVSRAPTFSKLLPKLVSHRYVAPPTPPRVCASSRKRPL